MSGITATGSTVVLASVAIPLVDHTRTLVMGKRLIKMWTSASECVATMTPDESVDENAPTLHVVFDSYALPVKAVVPTWDEVQMGAVQAYDSPVSRERAHTVLDHQLTHSQREKLAEIEKLDSLHEYVRSHSLLLFLYCRLI